ncbi:MAG: methyltransferase domain-containing protein [Alphaproteobacteria bacterium]|nr:methyltransferase domain-containing protein [Alphaproteobacteria bacterium]
MDSPFKPMHFARVDETPDTVFYRPPRIVSHIDEPAQAALAAFYRERLPAGGRILDLMSSCVSHLPAGVSFDRVIGHGMNVTELKANPQLTGGFVQDLNRSPPLPFADATFDACVLAVSVQYLTRPLEVFAEVARVLKPGAPFVISFSNRMFPTKAVALWRALDDHRHGSLVDMYFRHAGGFGASDFLDISPLPGRSDPLYVVVANRA